MHMRQEQRANRTGDKEMQFPEHTKVIEKLNEILNWMSSPTYCPTIDPVVMEYQADHPYKEPPPRPRRLWQRNQRSGVWPSTPCSTLWTDSTTIKIW